MELQEAIALVKASGFTVSKPREKKLKTVGPTFVAHWLDGVVTRMSIHTTDENPDFRRAIRVSHAAYESRTKGLGFSTMITEGHFMRGNKTLSSIWLTDAADYLN